MTHAIAKSAENPTVTSISRSIFGSWQFWLMLAAAALTVGVTFNWNWLVAAGIAPLIVAVLPCAVMCGLGLCMAKKGAGGGCHGGGQKPPVRTGTLASSVADQNRSDAT